MSENFILVGDMIKFESERLDLPIESLVSIELVVIFCKSIVRIIDLTMEFFHLLESDTCG